MKIFNRFRISRSECEGVGGQVLLELLSLAHRSSVLA